MPPAAPERAAVSRPLVPKRKPPRERKRKPPAKERALRAEPTPPQPPARQERAPASSHEARPRRFEPTRAADEPLETEWCSIRLTSRGSRGRFVALAGSDRADGENSVIARSPVFFLDGSVNGSQHTPPEALHELVGELAAAGWRQTDKGRRPWDLHFRRAVEAARPVER